jgi:hypothetical protein
MKRPRLWQSKSPASDLAIYAYADNTAVFPQVRSERGVGMGLAERVGNTPYGENVLRKVQEEPGQILRH